LTPPLIRQGEGLAGYHRIQAERTAARSKLEQILNTPAAAPQTRIVRARSGEWDPQRLRGIPALARGVGSAIPGSVPGAAWVD